LRKQANAAYLAAQAALTAAQAVVDGTLLEIGDANALITADSLLKSRRF
jgi:hypothetical protein